MSERGRQGPKAAAIKRSRENIWRHEITAVEGSSFLFGVNLFDYEWNRTEESAFVRGPLYHQNYRFSVYTARIAGRLCEFAAGEFSGGVWGFYLPTD